MLDLSILNAGPALIVLVTVFGLIVGSFLNVVIYRLPKIVERSFHEQCAELNGAPLPAAPRYNLATPSSSCPACGHKITMLQNIPVLSYIFLRGKCVTCKTRIGLRYPLVELITGVLSGYIAWYFGGNAQMIAALLFCWALIALSFIDFDTQLLLDDITLPLVWLGLLFNIGTTFVDLQSAVIGAVAGYLSLWSVYWLFKLITGKEGMGYGDFKLLAAIGAWLGWKMLPVVILLSSLVGAVVGLGLIIFMRRDRQIPIPFGPYLALAGMISLFWGEALVDLYTRGF